MIIYGIFFNSLKTNSTTTIVIIVIIYIFLFGELIAQIYGLKAINEILAFIYNKYICSQILYCILNFFGFFFLVGGGFGVLNLITGLFQLYILIKSKRMVYLMQGIF